MKVSNTIVPAAKTFEDLVVWQHAHRFVLDIYRLSRIFPTDERFGLTSQIGRAAVSIPANIAEGFRRKNASDKVRFFNIAQASLEEVRYYLILVQDLNYGDTAELRSEIAGVSRLLNAYTRKVRASVD